MSENKKIQKFNCFDQLSMKVYNRIILNLYNQLFKSLKISKTKTDFYN